MNSSWFSNFSIYCENLSFYFAFSVILSFTAVFVTWWFHKSEIMKPDLAQGDSDADHEGVFTLMKRAHQEALMKNMTQQQIQQERKTEKEQLSAIFELLLQQQDKFQVNSMEEVESQLRLYRTN